MSSQFLVTTTATVVLPDLGARTLTHPTTALDLLLEFTQKDLADSADLAAAILAGDITVTDGDSNPITIPALQLDYVLQDELDLHVAASNPHGVTAGDVGAEPADGAIQSHLSVTSGNPHGTDAADVGAIPTTEKGAANGVATLDGGGKVPASQLTLTGVVYKGTWNASTNTPSLSNGSGSAGDYYVVSTAGSTSLDGVSDWAIGDWVIANSSVWEKNDHSDAVSSVAGKVGAVSLVSADVGLGNVSNDAQLKRGANDYLAFTETTSPANGDLVLLEQASGGAKRKVQVTNLVGGSLDAAIAAYLDRQFAENTTPANNNTTTGVVYLTHTFTPKHLALYQIRTEFLWSLNTTSSDFIAKLVLDGTPLGDGIVIEPQDSGGSGSYGTNQLLDGVLSWGFTPVSLVPHTIELQFRGSISSINAAMYEARMWIERWTQ